ncbi:MAG: methyltransferase domain-containing protein [Acidimicrobiales bacterium]|nr:methyltransferase domain-containing protein [Acidimicrobiales bacterium]
MAHDHDATADVYNPNFDDKAASWDDPAKRERARLVAESIVGIVSPDRTTRLFEYGAGTGLVTEAFGGRVGPALLADSSAGMREVMATKVLDGRLRDARVTDLDLSVPDAVLPDERFDLVVTVMVLHHVLDLDLVLSRFRTLLEPTGHLCIVDLDAEDGSFHGDGFVGHHGFEREALRSRLESVGFSDVDITDCGHVSHDDGTFSLFLAVARP